MRIACQQPHYFPWLGYFELFRRVDAFVFLDSVQWIRQGRQHRTKILSHGEPHWLTVPVKGHGHREKSLKDMRVDRSLPWARRHWALVEEAYGSAPRFRDQLEPLLRPFFAKAEGLEFLVDVIQESLWLFWDALHLKTELHWSSELPEKPGRNERLIALCEALCADEYYSSLGSTRYLDLSAFRAQGIRVQWQHFRANFPGEPLRPSDLSILDWAAFHDWSVLREAITPRSGFPSRPPLPPENTTGF